MTYLGDWGQEDFHGAAPDGDGQALFHRVVEDMDEHVWASADDGSIFGIYVFRCRTCAQLRAYYDFT